MAETDFKGFADKTLLRADKLIRAVGIKLFSAVIMDSPVGDPSLWKGAKGIKAKPPKGYVGGRLRGNWRCSLSKADTTAIVAPKGKSAEYKNFPDVGKVVQSVHDVCQSATRNNVIWLANSLPYVARIEYEGHSSQAPEGMVRRNCQRIHGIIVSELRRMKGSST